MQKIRCCLLAAFLLPTLIFGKIIETSHFAEIYHHITPHTLVLLDVDDTLLIPNQTLGTDVWFIYRKAQYCDSGLSAAEALEKALADWESIRHLTKVSIVEEGADAIIQDLQNKGVPVMGLTTQGLALTTRTLQQLASLNIRLTPTAPSSQDHYFINGPHGVLYREGLMFTSGTPKGKALLKLLAEANFKPEHIVFINDKASHLEDVETEVLAAGMAFTGLRYSYSDERVAQFDPEIAEIQWRYSTFAYILSDAEAMAIKQKLADRNAAESDQEAVAPGV